MNWERRVGGSSSRDMGACAMAGKEGRARGNCVGEHSFDFKTGPSWIPRYVCVKIKSHLNPALVHTLNKCFFGMRSEGLFSQNVCCLSIYEFCGNVIGKMKGMGRGVVTYECDGAFLCFSSFYFLPMSFAHLIFFN